MTAPGRLTAVKRMTGGDLDAVLGLSVTRSRVGWVLVAGHEGNGTILDGAEFAVGESRELPAVEAARQAAQLVERISTERAGRLHAICVTGRDAAASALLQEFLADRDPVVSVRYDTAVALVGAGRHSAPSEMAVAGGAARALDLPLEEPGEPHEPTRCEPARTRSLTYASAAATLVAAAITFVVSLALAVGLELAPEAGQPRPVTDQSTLAAPSR